MRFRSPTGKPIHVATIQGHAARVTDKWRELPALLHDAAIQAGCEQEGKGKPPPKVPNVAGPGAMNQVADTDGEYRQALTTMISRDTKGDFTRDSLPNIAVVSKLCGFTAVKEDVLRVFREMKAEADVDGSDAQS